MQKRQQFYRSTTGFWLSAILLLCAERGRSGEPLPQPGNVHDAELARFGIVSVESKRLKLYTDLPRARVQSIPGAADALYGALVDYFGPPPRVSRSEFRVTGYLMSDKEIFRRAGVLPIDLPPFLNGRHRGLEFWANEQPTDYYRCHLALHEFTHCFMFATPDVRIPPWYMEGMAELFATHRIDDAGRYHFRVFPDQPEHFEGLGRIALVRKEGQQGHWKALADLRRLQPEEFSNNTAYAWSWAACAFLDGHPRYRTRFHDLGAHLTGSQFGRTLSLLFEPDVADLGTEWSLFSHQIQHGYEFARAAIDFKPGSELPPNNSPRAITVVADRGWQSGGIRVHSGRTYSIRAGGRVQLAAAPKPWLSEPQGISIEYAEGRPIGILLAAIRQESPSAGAPESMLKEYPIGREGIIEPSVTGTLYFRINDRWGSLTDNSGAYRIEIRNMGRSGARSGEPQKAN